MSSDHLQEAKATNADENILCCCLHFKEEVYEVTLLTDDTNLQLKALSNGIAVPLVEDYCDSLKVQFSCGSTPYGTPQQRASTRCSRNAQMAPSFVFSEPTFTN